MQIDISQFHQVFFEEVADHIAAIERSLLAIDPAHPGREQLDQVFRAAHSIKGASATFGFPDLAEVTHALESLLGAVRGGELAMDREIADAVLYANDVLKVLLDDARAYRPSDSQLIRTTRQRLDALIEQAARRVPEPEPAELFGFFDAPAPEPAPEEDPGFGFFDDAYTQPPVAAPAVMAPVPPTPIGSETSIRVGVERVDQLVNLVGELVITQSMLQEASQPLDPAVHERLHRAVDLLERHTRQLQEAVLGIRMMPIAFVFNRLPRLVRDLATKLGKSATLTLYGEGTELDRSVIEHIADPLMHIVRNCLDHGIERPAVRTAAGKPADGNIVITAQSQGGNIVVAVSDDGAGLSRERILAKARAQGLPVHDAMSDEEVWQLVFLPGFSTAEAVTDVSGRGVGMDVVRRNVQEIGGRIELESRPGAGTCFTIRLPLTLAIVDGMAVTVGPATYILPLNHVTESLLPETTRSHSVAGEGAVVEVRGEYLPLVELAEVLGSTVVRDDAGIVVLVESAGERAGLRVDALLGDRQVVVKSLEANYRKVPGLSGATILGDGAVALIVDVAEVVRLASRGAAQHAGAMHG